MLRYAHSVISRVGEKMIDIYSKIVLTVIAVALAGIAIQGFTKPAVGQLGVCGSSFDPCYVTTTRGKPVAVTNDTASGLPVYIMNMRY